MVRDGGAHQILFNVFATRGVCIEWMQVFERYSRMLLETAGVAQIVGDRQLTAPDERTATSEARDLVLRARAGDL